MCIMRGKGEKLIERGGDSGDRLPANICAVGALAVWD